MSEEQKSQPSTEGYRKQSFLAELIKKEADMRSKQEATGANLNSLIQEAQRQQAQVSKEKKGNPITGDGATKSGPED